MSNKKDLLIVGINGSPHRNGLGAGLLTRALAQAEKEGARTALVHLVDCQRTFFDGDYSRVPPGMEKIFDLMEEAGGVIFSTPTHWFNMSSLMNNFICQLTYLEEMQDFKLQGKIAGFIATCEEDGGQKAILDMAGPLNHMGFIIPPYAMLFYNNKEAHLSERGWQQKDAELIGSSVARLAQALCGMKWGYEKMAEQ